MKTASLPISFNRIKTLSGALARTFAFLVSALRNGYSYRGLLILALLLSTAPAKADFLLWLDSPSGRVNRNDPKSPWHFNTPTPLPAAPKDAWDPMDDSAAGATPLSISILPQQTAFQAHVVGYGSDQEDYFSLSLVAGELYDFSAVKDGGVSSVSIEIRDSNGALVGTVSNDPSVAMISGFNPALSLGTGTYYVVVRSAWGVSYHLTYSQRPAGTKTNTPTHTPSSTRSSTPRSTLTFSPSPLATATLTQSPVATATSSITSSPSSTQTPSFTPSASNTVSYSSTPTLSSSPTPTVTLSSSPSPTFSNTPQGTLTDSPTLTSSMTSTNTTVSTPSYTKTLVSTPTCSDTRTASPSSTPSLTASPTLTSSPTSSNTPQGTLTFTPTFSNTTIPTPAFTATLSGSPTFTATRTTSPTSTLTSTATLSSSATPSRTASPTFSNTPQGTLTFTPSVSDTPVPTPSFTVTLTGSPTRTSAPTLTSTLVSTPTFTATLTSSPTPSATPTVTRSSSPTPSPTPTFTATQSCTPTPSRTASPTLTSSPTSSNTTVSTPSFTATLSSSPTRTSTPSVTNTTVSTSTFTATLSNSPTRSSTPTVTNTTVSTPTFTATPTASPTSSAASSSTLTSSPSPISTSTPTVTSTTVSTSTYTATLTNSPTRTSTPTMTNTSVSTSTFTATPTASPTSSATSSSTLTGSPSPTRTSTPTVTNTTVSTATFTATPSSSPTRSSTPTLTNTSASTPSDTVTPTASPTRSSTPSATPTGTSTRTSSPSPTWSPTPTYSLTSSPTPTPSLTATPTFSMTISPTRTPTLTSTPTRTASPTFTSTPVSGVLAPCGTAFNIDGQLNESAWTGGSWVNISNLTAGTLGLSAAGKYQVYWDATNLYIGVQITKNPATLYTGTAGALWSSDSFELYFDMAHNKATTYDANDFHYTFGWNFATPDISAGASLTGVTYGYFNTGTGWSGEVRIPWSSLGVTPAQGAVYGFDVAVNVASAAATRQCQLTWHSTTGTNFSDTSQFGDLNLGTACPYMSPTRTPTPGAATFTPTPTAAVATPTNTPVTRGATLPYDEYEAENGVLAGGASIVGPSRTVGTAANEASGRRAVQLSATNHSVAVSPSKGFNAIVVRFSIPDAAGGGGISSTISLYIGGTFIQKLNLTSKYAYAYGGWTIPYNQNPSGGTPVHQFDEVRALLPASYAAGTEVRLQRDSTDTAAFYIIDLIDLENVGAAIAAPANSLDAKAGYGAVGNDSNDDTTALQNCINAAQSQGKIAYIPAGTYRITAPLSIPAVSIQGAGMWRTTIHQANDTSGLRVNAGGGSFFIGDLALNGEVLNRVDTATDSGLDYHGGNGSQLARVWIEHFKCGWWVGNSGTVTNNLTITGCRIRNTYADGVNFCNGTSNSTVTNTHLRGTGDDALASWSPSASAANTNNIFSFNTVQLPWRANCIAVYGGSSSRIEDNIVSDTSNYPGILVAQEFTSTAISGTQSVQRNTLLRCGGSFGGTNHGAFKISTAQGAVGGIQAANLDILDSTFAGVFVEGGSAANGTFNTINITTAGGWGMQSPTTSGTIQCTNVIVSGAASGGMTSGGLNFAKVSGNAGW